MEATALSVGKSVLKGALGYAKSALAEEVALQLGIQRDHAFIRDELEMMLAFLMAAHEERDEHMVVKTWVKQVRDVAYDAEDSLEDFAVRLGKPSWWRVFRTLLDRRRVAKQIKELRVKVEDVSQRNVRYCLIKGRPDTKPPIGTGQSSMMTGETMSEMEEARREKDKARVDLIRLINEMDESLRVITIWGPSSVPEEASIIKLAYDHLKRRKKFECYALIQIMHPFNPTEFLKNIVRQFYVDSLEETKSTAQQGYTTGAQDLRRMGMMTEGDLVGAFKKYLNEKRYLIVLTDLSKVEEWDQIKALFPSNNKGSRLIVCAEQVEVASLCVDLETALPEHKQLSSKQVLYAFYEKGSKGGANSMGEGSSSNTTDIIDSKSPSEGKRLTRLETTLAAIKEAQLIGREKDKSEIVKKISYRHSQEFDVISICGMGGLGKTTLVKHVYQSQELNTMFEKRACVTIKRPFNPNELLNSLATQLGGKEGEGNKLSGLLDEKSYLVILDDMASTAEWDAIKEYFPTTVKMSRIIVTTREENICRHCSKKKENIYKLELLQDEDAQRLFIEKVFGTVTCLEEEYPELVDETNQILRKCNGLPLAIVTMGGFLAKQAKTVTEWRKFNEHINAELVMNMELQSIPNALIKSYEGLPYHLKSCFLYMSIFPEDYNISRRRLVRRWIAEGYSSEVRGKSLEEIADSYFLELIDRSVILPVRNTIFSRKGIDSCQLHDLMREISISRAMDENLVFRLEEGSSSSNNTQAKIRHVAISSNWEGDKSEFESAVDLSHVRSLTVFGKVRPFFISDKMSLLRVLDLEGTKGLLDHHLEHIARLLHLKYICLRRCYGIYHLPDSWGNLRQLQTLDMKRTHICYLPKTITNLTKLQYLLVGGACPSCVWPDDRLPHHLAKLCGACFAPKLLKNIEGLDGDPNWHDACKFWCHIVFPTLASRRLWPFGVVVPRGVRKLKALRTLGEVNIAGSGKASLRGIRKLTQLRKLAVTGINHKNYEELCSTLAELSCLESLSMESNSTDESGLHGCLDDVSSPLKNMQSVKMTGSFVKLPEWIGGLHRLVKLKLENTVLSEFDATIQVLGRLPNLAILSLWKSFEGEDLRLIFHREAFSSLMVLQVCYIGGLRSVEFAEEATPKLELLSFAAFSHDVSGRMFSGLASLPRLKEFILDFDYVYSDYFVKELRHQLAKIPLVASLPRLKKFMLNNDDRYNKDFVKELRHQLVENPSLASLPELKEFILYNEDYIKDFVKDVRDQLADNTNAPVLKWFSL